MVSRSSNCGRQSRVERMRPTSATSAGGSPGRRPAISTGKSRPLCALDRFDHLEHRSAVAVAAVERRAGPAAPQIGERRRMRAREIADVDVVADAGAVRRRIVGAVDVDLGPLAERRFAGDLDQMRRRRRRLAGAQLRIGAGDVEIAQHHEAQPVGAAGVVQHDLRHQLRGAVRRDRRGRRILAHRHVLGIAVDRRGRGKDELPARRP